MAWKDSVAGLRRFAAAPWFPIAVGLLSGLNIFTLVLAGPLVILFCSAVLANPKRWFTTALANALGTVLGCMLLMYFIEIKGTDYIKDSFPSTFSSKWWSWTEGMMQAYGSVAAVPVAAMPIILHPLVFFGKLSKMGDVALLLSILVGRVAKYCIMAQVVKTAPGALKYFGASKETIAMFAEPEVKKAAAAKVAATKPAGAAKTEAAKKDEATNARKRASTPEGRRVVEE